MAATLKPEEKGAITDFKRAARDFWSMWLELESKGDYVDTLPEVIQSDYDDLIGRGKIIRISIESVTGIIDSAVNTYKNLRDWVSEKFGLDGLETVSPQALGSLGILFPLVPVAVIAASVAAIGYWVKDVYKFNAKLNEIQRLENTGLSPQEAAAIVAKNFSQGMFSSAASLVLPLVLGGVLLYFIKRG